MSLLQVSLLILLLDWKSVCEAGSEVASDSVDRLVVSYQTRFCPEATCRGWPAERRRRSLGRMVSPELCSLCQPCRCDALCVHFQDCCYDLQLSTPPSSPTPRTGQGIATTSPNIGRQSSGNRHQRQSFLEGLISLSESGNDTAGGDKASNDTEREIHRDTQSKMQTWSVRGRVDDHDDDSEGKGTENSAVKTNAGKSGTNEEEIDTDTEEKTDDLEDLKGVTPPSLECTLFAEDSYWASSSCRQGDRGFSEEVAGRCRRDWREDPLSLSPVTVAALQGQHVVFRNRHCALCAGKSQFDVWQVQVRCSSARQLQPWHNVSQLLQQALRQPSCTVRFLPPPGPAPRTCLPPARVLHNCSSATGPLPRGPTPTHEAVRRACAAYTSPFHMAATVYGNMFCYLCNGGKERYLSDKRPCSDEEDGDESWIKTTSSLLTLLPQPLEERKSSQHSCQADAVYDPIQLSCRRLTCPAYREARRRPDGSVTCRWLFQQVRGVDIQVHCLLHVPSHAITVTHNQVNATARRVIASLRTHLMDQGRFFVTFARVFTLTQHFVNVSGGDDDLNSLKTHEPLQSKYEIKAFRVILLVRNEQLDNPDTVFGNLLAMFETNVTLWLRGQSITVGATLLEESEFSNDSNTEVSEQFNAWTSALTVNSVSTTECPSTGYTSDDSTYSPNRTYNSSRDNLFSNYSDSNGQGAAISKTTQNSEHLQSNKPQLSDSSPFTPMQPNSSQNPALSSSPNSDIYSNTSHDSDMQSTSIQNSYKMHSTTLQTLSSTTPTSQQRLNSIQSSTQDTSQEVESQQKRIVVFSTTWLPDTLVKRGMLHAPVPLFTRLTCPTVQLAAGGFSVLGEEEVFLHVFNDRLRGRPFKVTQDGSLHICVDDFITMAKLYQQTVLAPKFSTFLIIVTLLQCASLLCLVLTVAALLCLRELRTVPGYNLLFLAVSLLLAQLPLSLPVLSPARPGPCLALALWLHYAWLLVFAWMLVASCHMHRSLGSQLTIMHQSNQGKSPVVRYCLLAFGLPLLLVAAHVATSSWRSDGTSHGYERTGGLCFLADDAISIVTFTLPLLFTVGVTTGLLVLTTCSMRRARLARQAMDRRYSYLLHCGKLSTLTGVTWAVGLAGQWTRNDVTLRTFDVLCGVHGLFLFLAFIVNRRTGRLLLSSLKFRSSTSANSCNRLSDTSRAQPELPVAAP